MAFLLRKPRLSCSSITKYLAKTLHKSTTDEIASDAITEFTDELLSKRQLRWEILKQKQTIGSTSPHISRLKDVANFIESMKRTTETSGSEVMFLSVDFEKLDESHIDHLVLAACRDKNNEFIEKFVDQCVDGNKVIGENSVLTICEHFSTLSDNRTLMKLIDLCKSNNRLVYEQNCKFKHFIARNLWQKGNSDGALTLLHDAFEQANESVRTSIRYIFRFIVDDTVNKKSEAVLVRLIKSAALLQERLDESTILLYIWKTCFLSSWFSDQVIADQLFSEYSEIRSNAAKRLAIQEPFIFTKLKMFCLVHRRGILSYNALCTGQVDVVHRLIEAFLKFDMKEECKLILELLFEYQCKCKLHDYVAPFCCDAIIVFQMPAKIYELVRKF